jgi:cell division protein ZapA
MGREYGLRVQEDAIDETRRIASVVDQRMKQFRKAHPEQAELTTAVMTALAFAEELHEEREDHEQGTEAVTDALGRLSNRLEAALDEEG